MHHWFDNPRPQSNKTLTNWKNLFKKVISYQRVLCGQTSCSAAAVLSPSRQRAAAQQAALRGTQQLAAVPCGTVGVLVVVPGVGIPAVHAFKKS